MKLSLQTFSTLVANSAAAVQAGTTQLLDLSTGSVLRAVLEANGSIGLWMQWLIVQVLRVTRAATSTGADLDSWMGDFGFTRLPATYAVGQVTFSRFNASASASILPGVQLKTADGTQTFVVTTDTTNSAWNTTAGAYVINSGLPGITVPIIAQAAGAAGNVQSATITLIASPIIGVDLVSNALATTGGSDTEPDPSYLLRFGQYINSRSRATLLAVQNAISGVQQGLTSAIMENVDTSGNFRPGSFVVTIDDGSGYPSSSVLNAVSTAIGAVRPIGSVFVVNPPTVVLATISASITLVATADRNTVVTAITTGVTSFVDGLPIGAALPATRIAQIAYDADPSVINVTAVQLNGSSSDLVAGASSVIKLASFTVN
jgi:uncharacterized phage protein gp47/JayE